MATETTTRPTRPTRTRKAAAPAAGKPAKAATPKATKVADATEGTGQLPPTEDGRARFYVVLEHYTDTKSYSVFQPPKSSGCVGKFYAPLGTEEVKVLLIGAA